jgi:hypothetical protein
MTTLVSTDARTQTIPRVQAAVVAVTNVRVATPGRDAKVAVPEPDAEDAAPEPSTEIACEESVEHIYEAGLAKLEALHDRWAAAMAEIRQTSASGEPGEAAA